MNTFFSFSVIIIFLQTTRFFISASEFCLNYFSEAVFYFCQWFVIYYCILKDSIKIFQTSASALSNWIAYKKRLHLYKQSSMNFTNLLEYHQSHCRPSYLIYRRYFHHHFHNQLCIHLLLLQKTHSRKWYLCRLCKSINWVRLD